MNERCCSGGIAGAFESSTPCMKWQARHEVSLANIPHVPFCGDDSIGRRRVIPGSSDGKARVCASAQKEDRNDNAVTERI